MESIEDIENRELLRRINLKPERFVYKIDIGNVDPKEAMAKANQFMEKMLKQHYARR